MDERPPLLTFVGIDVAKDRLDVALRPQGEPRHVPNDTDAMAGIVTWLLAVAPEVLVVEATGGDEAPLVAELGVAKLPVAVVHPRQGRHFATASGQLAKTDRLDAEALAHCADAVRPTPRPLPDLAAQELPSPLGTPTGTDWDAGGGGESSGSDACPHRPGASPGAPGLAERGGEGGRSRDPPTGRSESAVARSGRPLADRPWRGSHHRTDPASGSARAGSSLAWTDRRLGRRGAAQSGFRGSAGTAQHLGGTSHRAGRAVSGSVARDPL
jgi:hypothetical protein